jgi:hypothetical protein
MGSLSNLYISQSYQSLAHLGTNNALVSGTMTVLQDGLGNSLNISFDGTNISSSGNIFAANLTGSGVLPAGVISSSAQITSLGFVSSSVTASSLITASFDNGTRNLTFTKGDASTFNVNIPDVSGSTGNFATTGSNVFIGDQTISGSLFVSGSEVLRGTLSASALRVENNTHLDGTLTVTNDTLINGDVTIQSATPNLKLRDTSGGGFSSGYDLRVDTGSFEIYDDTHNRDVLSDFFNSASQQHTTSLTSEIIVISGSTSVTLIGNVSASIISASTINGLGDPLAFSQSVDSRLDTLETATASLFTSASLSLTTASVTGTTMTFTKGDGTTFNVTLPTGSGGGSIDTGSFATTGSNNFTGPQTLTDPGFVNQITLDDYSGSLVLFAKGYTSSSLSHISASNASISASVANLIFKTSNTTPDTILTGSQNIFANPFTATAGFKRYIGGNANIFLGASSVPQISGSMGFSPTMNLNSGGGNYIFRGPVSSSTWALSNNLNIGIVNIGQTNADRLTSGLTFNSNTIQGSVTINATSAFLTGSTTTFSNNSVNGGVTLNLNSSAANLTNNIISDSGFQLVNNYWSSSIGLGSLTVQRNTISGQSNIITVSGSQPTGTRNAPTISDNLIGGASNILFSDIGNVRVVTTNAYNNASRNIIFGQSLLITGSSFNNDASTLGSAFFGRFNSNDSIRNKTSDIVFAVGTGTSASTRKTGFLIDSGSNSFFEGTVNISGSLLVNGIAPAVVDTGSFVTTSSFNAYTASQSTGSFATTGSNFFNGNQRITGSLIVSGAFETTQDITIQDASGNPTLKIGRGAGNQPSNLRFGVQALATTGVGLNNIAIGNSAMQYSSESLATENISIGGESLQYTQEGQQIAIGTSALRYTTTGKQNLAIGAFALQNNITGNENVAIGFNSLLNDTDGIRNIAIGPSSAENFRSGSNNIFIGFQTGNSISGSNNVILGAYNGIGETINNNIILADGAGNKELQFSGSTWTTENNFVVSGSLSAANNIKMGRGVDKPTNKVTVGSGGLIVSNSLVTSDSYIFATNDTTVGNYSPVVSNITAGSFSLSNGGYAGNIDVMYMIVNPY